ncbi:zinc finger MYM-type 1-like [Paramuricea clavata]|uniref:Zinc finger MYM-type 1-like n=1 Tax=Paramuricea clavata TaxID=317549 RepID=A0A6S7II73_PARCT|nr:zinc finger MYM-type 1-like [Paramuricea clavata]
MAVVFNAKFNGEHPLNLDLQIMPGIEASEFDEPLGCTATTPALPPLNDSELEVATDSETGSSSPNSAQNITLIETQDGPRQPRLHKFPVRDPKSKKTKSFQASWYSWFDWLEYSLEEDAAFCYPCRKFSVKTSAVATSALTFTETGYKNWANALDANKGLSKHEHSETHKNCYAKWSDLKKIEADKEKDIRSRINPDHEEVARGNREYLSSLFKYVIWFTTNEVPMRGGDETEESKNPGKWISFIKLQLETNPAFLKLHQKFMSNRTAMDYTSKTSINEFIEIIADSVRLVICSQIKYSGSGLFSASIDESKDTAKREELAIAVRYYVGTVVERFYDLRPLEDFGAQSIMTFTKEVIDLIIERSGAAVISLGADGASVMSGEYAGVAELLRSGHFPWLIYIHCTAHRLNLVVNDIIKGSPLALDIMTMINSLYSFFNIPKIRSLYQTVYQELYPRSQIRYLHQQIEMRWGCKFEAVDLLVDKPEVFLETLVRVAMNRDKVHDPKHVERAADFYHKLITTKVVIGLIILRAYLAELYFLSKELQTESINWTDVQHELTITRGSLDAITVDQLLKDTEKFFESIGIPMDVNLDCFAIVRTRYGTRQQSDSNLESSISEMNSYMKEKIDEEFNVRFDAKNVEVMKSFEAL